MVGPGQQRGSALARAGLGHDLGGGVRLRERGGGVVRVEGGAGGTLVRDLVQPVAQPLGQPPGVGEDDGGAVCLDEIRDALLHMRPDRGLLRLGGVPVGGRRASQLAQILDRDDHRQVELLGGGRLDDLHLALRRQEAGHLPDRADRRGEPDPPGGAGQQLVQPLQGEREMGAALRTGDGVHLVEDHRLDARQRVPGGGREHQEQRLGRGDQDVRRPGHHRAPLGGRGVTGPDAHPHLRLGQAQAHRLLADAGQRGAQIPLHVDRQRLERGHVQHAAALLRLGGRRPRGQPVQRGEERGQRLAGAGRRDHQHVAALADGPPGAFLRGGGRAEGTGEPAAGRGREGVESGAGHVPHRAPRH